MRFLNKIVFIHSATIQYAEVMLDGNVHLIGTQGVGKSTLLRAVLFFYNADTLKLGISREKKNFAEYYFPYQNSFLIYEVLGEAGPFCILAFKSQGKVCFHFIDGPYNRLHYVPNTGMAYEKWEDIRRVLDEALIGYSRKIDSYEEYRNIIYGNIEGGKKEFARYALLESKQYKNIPRTIQNVFLNSKLEAEFIKQTIIMSLNEEDITIDLQSYTHHLKDFESQLNDLHMYSQPHVQKQAAEAVKNHLAINHLDNEKNVFALQLAWRAASYTRAVPKLNEKKDKITDEIALLKEDEANLSERFTNKTDKIKARINVLDSEIKKAKEKTDYYNAQQIDSVIMRSANKKTLETEQEHLKHEIQLLTAAFSSITTKYESLFTALKQSNLAEEQDNKGKQVALREHAATEKEALRGLMEKALTEIKQQNQENIQQARLAVQQKQGVLQQGQLKKAAITHQRFFEAEVEETRGRINNYSISLQETQLQLDHLKKQAETVQQQWSLAEDSQKQSTERQEEKIQSNIASKRQEVLKINEKLEVIDKAFYGWLNIHKPGWEGTIGKVGADELLFDTSLAPRLSGAVGNLFGIDLDLSDMPIRVKTAEQYALQQEGVNSEIKQLEQEVASIQAELLQQLEKLKKKYQPELKKVKDGLLEKKYKQEQDTIQLQQARLQQKDWEFKAANARRDSIAVTDAAIARANEALAAAEQALKQKEEELSVNLKLKEKEYTKKISAADQQLAQGLAQLTNALKAQQAAWKLQAQELETRSLEELAGKGVDTLRIEAINATLQKVAGELAFIDGKRDLLIMYHNDRKEWIDRAGEFKSNKAAQEQQLTHEFEKYSLQHLALKDKIAEAGERLSRAEAQLVEAEDNLNAFDRFQQTDAWLSIEPAYIQEKDTNKNERTCLHLIDEINRCHYNAITRLDNLKEAANKFLGNFSVQNIFNFPQVLSTKQDYRQFTEKLNEFVNNGKIAEFEKRVNERFANVIKLVGKETADLMSRTGDIQKIISNINRDFESKNFVGAIKKIELRINDSANSVVQLLIRIKKFNDEHSFDIGGLNLFSSTDSENKNKKAVDLLKQLSKAITEYRREAIALSDSFELQFRVEENENDTGWVEKLSNVGSEGTDVLVKAMINIMLLNVFKEGASKRFSEFRLHCMMDEIGKLHPNNIKGILQFANDRNILLINGSPTETNASNYRHIYKLEKDNKRFTKIKRIITNYSTT